MCVETCFRIWLKITLLQSVLWFKTNPSEWNQTTVSCHYPRPDYRDNVRRTSCMPRFRHGPLYLFTVLNAPPQKYKLWTKWIVVLFLVFLAAFHIPLPPSFSVTPHSLYDSYCHPEELRVSSKKLKSTSNYDFPISTRLLLYVWKGAKVQDQPGWNSE